jgi:hypothetical protein
MKRLSSILSASSPLPSSWPVAILCASTRALTPNARHPESRRQWPEANVPRGIGPTSSPAISTFGPAPTGRCPPSTLSTAGPATAPSSPTTRHRRCCRTCAAACSTRPDSSLVSVAFGGYLSRPWLSRNVIHARTSGLLIPGLAVASSETLAEGCPRVPSAPLGPARRLGPSTARWRSGNLRREPRVPMNFMPRLGPTG